MHWLWNIFGIPKTRIVENLKSGLFNVQFRIWFGIWWWITIYDEKGMGRFSNIATAMNTIDRWIQNGGHLPCVTEIKISEYPVGDFTQFRMRLINTNKHVIPRWVLILGSILIMLIGIFIGISFILKDVFGNF